MKRFGYALGVVLLLFFLLPQKSLAETACTPLCIVEFRVAGAHAEEEQDYVLIANTTAASVTTTGLQVQYLNESGVLVASMNTSIGTFAAGQVKQFVAPPLKELNTQAGTLNASLFSGGGSLRIVRVVSGTVTKTYDQVGWGSALVFEGQPLVGAVSYVRNNLGGVIVDSDVNTSDFTAAEQNCTAPAVVEVQPFAAYADGSAKEAWIELVGAQNPSGDCILASSSGEFLVLGADSLPAGEAVVVDGYVDVQGTRQPLRLDDQDGSVWIAEQSHFIDISGKPVLLPLETQKYQGMVNGQSWALIEGVWYKTFMPTRGDANVYLAAPPLFEDDPQACGAVYISEVLPNPAGEDTGREWVELHTTSDAAVSLERCIIDVAGEQYHFAEQDMLEAGEWRHMTSLFAADKQTPKTFSLRNTDETIISLLRARADGTHDVLQRAQYQDAPEGASWVRLQEEWSWKNIPTPSLDNTQMPVDTLPPIEPAAGSDETPSDNLSQPIQITELLPNPAAPLTDDVDEYIELFNPTAQEVRLSGYKLQTGTSFSYSYTFTNEIIQPEGYIVISSGNSPLSLANSGGAARLLDPSGEVVSQTEPYSEAEEGSAWAYNAGLWQWTSAVTPGAVNTIVVPQAVFGSTKAKSTSKKASTAAKTTKSSAKTASAKTAKSGQVAGASTLDEETPPAQIHTSVLVGVGILAVLYAAYEYRQDIGNKIYQFRRYREHRRQASSKS